MPRPKQTVYCHPNKPYKAKGLCVTCYRRIPARRAARYRWELTSPKYKAIRNRYMAKKRVTDRASGLKRRYGLTIDQYNEIFELQGRVCKICKKLPGGHILYVDHDHKTNKTRGLLCAGCNSGLGHIENDGWLEAAQVYLQEYTCPL